MVERELEVRQLPAGFLARIEPLHAKPLGYGGAARHADRAPPPVERQAADRPRRACRDDRLLHAAQGRAPKWIPDSIPPVIRPYLLRGLPLMRGPGAGKRWWWHYEISPPARAACPIERFRTTGQVGHPVDDLGVGQTDLCEPILDRPEGPSPAVPGIPVAADAVDRALGRAHCEHLVVRDARPEVGACCIHVDHIDDLLEQLGRGIHRNGGPGGGAGLLRVGRRDVHGEDVPCELTQPELARRVHGGLRRPGGDEPGRRRRGALGELKQPILRSHAQCRLCAGSVGVPGPIGITHDGGRKRPHERRPVGAPRVDGQALHEGVLQRPHGVVRHRLTLGTHAGDDSGGLHHIVDGIHLGLVAERCHLPAEVAHLHVEIAEGRLDTAHLHAQVADALLNRAELLLVLRAELPRRPFVLAQAVSYTELLRKPHGAEHLRSQGSEQRLERGKQQPVGLILALAGRPPVRSVIGRHPGRVAGQRGATGNARRSPVRVGIDATAILGLLREGLA